MRRFFAIAVLVGPACSDEKKNDVKERSTDPLLKGK
jgi:hypothetical protein